MKPLNFVDLTGAAFGKLTVTAQAPSLLPQWKTRWHCRCECGKEIIAFASNLKRGLTRSCGCAAEMHSLSTDPIYSVWQGMMGRCYKTENKEYTRYGGRGIRVCAFLRATPQNLLHCIGKRPSNELTIDRINNDGHYSCGVCEECAKCAWPLNVRWATRVEQARNRRSSRFVTCHGETHTLEEWAEVIGISSSAVWRRANKGIDLFTPLDLSKRNHKVTH